MGCCIFNSGNQRTTLQAIIDNKGASDIPKSEHSDRQSGIITHRGGFCASSLFSSTMLCVFCCDDTQLSRRHVNLSLFHCGGTRSSTPSIGLSISSFDIPILLCFLFVIIHRAEGPTKQYLLKQKTQHRKNTAVERETSNINSVSLLKYPPCGRIDNHEKTTSCTKNQCRDHRASPKSKSVMISRKLDLIMAPPSTKRMKPLHASDRDLQTC